MLCSLEGTDSYPSASMLAEYIHKGIHQLMRKQVASLGHTSVEPSSY